MGVSGSKKAAEMAGKTIVNAGMKAKSVGDAAQSLPKVSMDAASSVSASSEINTASSVATPVSGDREFNEAEFNAASRKEKFAKSQSALIRELEEESNRPIDPELLQQISKWTPQKKDMTPVVTIHEVGRDSF